MDSWGRAFLDLLYPPVCLLCGGDSPGPHPHLCPACAGSFRPLGGVVCPVCGRPLEGSPDGTLGHPCLPCLLRPPPFAWCRSLYLFSGEMKRALSLLKFARRLSLLDPLRDALLAGVPSAGLPPFEAVVPVPLHPRTALRRTFNQAALLAAPLAGEAGVPLLTRALRRRGGTPQVGLTRAAREENAAGSFRAGWGMGKAEGRRVLLFDDVYTTGATVRAAARTLRAGGAAEVLVLTLARTPLAGGAEDLHHLGVEEAVRRQGA